MLPAFLGKLHPRYKTPSNAVIMIGAVSCLAPFFGRPMLVWLVDAGGLGIVIAYLFVALSFLVMRHKRADMPRPFKVRFGKAVGIVAVLLSLGMVSLYLPGSPSALLPIEWVVFGAWMLLGLVIHKEGRSVRAPRIWGAKRGSLVMLVRMTFCVITSSRKI